MSKGAQSENKIISQIQKLLRLADGTRGATPEEAAAAMAKAQELMTRYGIEQVEAGEENAGPSFDIGEDRVPMERVQRYDYDQNTAMILQKCFGVKVIWTTSYVENKKSGTKRLHHTYILIGDKLDRELARAAIPLIHQTFTRGVAAYLRSRGEEKWTARVARPWYDGVTVGYVEGSAQGKALAMAAAKRKNADAYAIVLVDKDNAINAYYKDKYPDVKNTRSNPRYQADADERSFRDGYQKGKELDLTQSKKLQ